MIRVRIGFRVRRAVGGMWLGEAFGGLTGGSSGGSCLEWIGVVSCWRFLVMIPVTLVSYC